MDRLRKALLSEYFQSLKKVSPAALGLIVLILVALLWGIHLSGDRVVNQTEFVGTLIGIHQVQTNMGALETRFSVKLSNDQIVLVSAGMTTPYRQDASVKIFKTKTESGHIFYYFGGYVRKNG